MARFRSVATTMSVWTLCVLHVRVARCIRGRLGTCGTPLDLISYFCLDWRKGRTGDFEVKKRRRLKSFRPKTHVSSLHYIRAAVRCDAGPRRRLERDTGALGEKKSRDRQSTRVPRIASPDPDMEYLDTVTPFPVIIHVAGPLEAKQRAGCLK